ncbi:hypothetical protein [Thermomonospora amylolytica]|uniref:hypothetical protein n=1 Tax=Thermomonospora amylolytica TaxID=1411117 RepID=UPI000E6D1015|nr:hypothetical protein [Thermomonospora amylolytica]
MDLYFVDRGLARQCPQLPASAGTAAALLDSRGIPDGTPVALDRQMRPVEPWCSWFRTLADEGKRSNTMRTYAYIASRLEDFLADRGSDVVSATETDLIAYRRHRTEWQDEPIVESTWDRESR